MSIRAVAKAAYEASQSDTVTAARNAMVALLGDPNAEFSTMQMVTAEAPPEHAHTLVIFTDDDSDIHLGVRREGDGWSVWLVADQDGWTTLGEQVKSLEHLWLLIAEHQPISEPTYPAWVQPSGAHDAYATGDRVTYEGKVWESLIDGNVWAPGVSGWREVV